MKIFCSEYLSLYLICQAERHEMKRIILLIAPVFDPIACRIAETSHCPTPGGRHATGWQVHRLSHSRNCDRAGIDQPNRVFRYS